MNQELYHESKMTLFLKLTDDRISLESFYMPMKSPSKTCLEKTTVLVVVVCYSTS